MRRLKNFKQHQYIRYTSNVLSRDYSAYPAKITFKGQKRFLFSPQRPIAFDKEGRLHILYIYTGNNLAKIFIHINRGQPVMKDYKWVNDDFKFYKELPKFLDNDARFKPNKIGVYNLDKLPSYDELVIDLLSKSKTKEVQDLVKEQEQEFLEQTEEENSDDEEDDDDDEEDEYNEEGIILPNETNRLIDEEIIGLYYYGT